MIAEPGRDWIAWFATARWNAGVNEAPTAQSICFGSFVRKVSLFTREASERCHAKGEGGLPDLFHFAIVVQKMSLGLRRCSSRTACARRVEATILHYSFGL